MYLLMEKEKRKKKEEKEKKKKEDGLHQKRKPDCYTRAGFAIQGNQLLCCRYPFYCISSLPGAIFLIRLHKGPWDETKLRSPACITHAKRSHAHKYRSCSPSFVYTCTKITYTQIQILQSIFCIHMHKDHIYTNTDPVVHLLYTHAQRSHIHKYRSCSPSFVYTCTKIIYTHA